MDTTTVILLCRFMIGDDSRVFLFTSLSVHAKHLILLPTSSKSSLFTLLQQIPSQQHVHLICLVFPYLRVLGVYVACSLLVQVKHLHLSSRTRLPMTRPSSPHSQGIGMAACPIKSSSGVTKSLITYTNPWYSVYDILR